MSTVARSILPASALCPIKGGAALFAVSALVVLAVGSAHAATPTIYAQDATITGAGDTVTTSRIPVQTSTGSIIYYDVTTVYGVTSKGVLSILSTTIKPSPNLIISNFQPGTYTAPGTFDWTERLSGPGVASGGATAWSFSVTGGSNKNCGVPTTATWYTGPVSGNPYYARIKAASIVTTAYGGFGIAGQQYENCSFGGSHVLSHEFGIADGVPALLGAVQTGGSLAISSFTDTNGKDHKSAVNALTFTLSKTQ